MVEVMNSVNLVGRITADPELKQTTSGKSVISFSLAVKRPRVKDTTDFLKIIAWTHTAEYVAKYAHKGDTLAVSGVITNREYEQNGRKAHSTEIIADEVQVLGNRQTAAGAADMPNFEEVPQDDTLPFQGGCMVYYRYLCYALEAQSIQGGVIRYDDERKVYYILPA